MPCNWSFCELIHMTHKYILHVPCKCLPDLCLHPINWRRFHFWTCRPHTESRDLCMPLCLFDLPHSSFPCTFTFMHLADAFIQSDLQCIQAIHFFVSMCVPWELNPQPLEGTQSSLQISHGYDYVFNRLCQKQVEA